MEAVLNKVILITGASRGIGRALFHHLALAGYCVIGCARDVTCLQGDIKKFAQERGLDQLRAITADVADEASVESLFFQIDQGFGRLDGLINNAGIFVKDPITEMSVESFDRVMAVNVRGVFLCSRAAFHRMQHQPDGGDIINVSSLAGVKGVEKFIGTSAYVASKYAVAGLTEQLAVEGKPLGIRVKAVSPGAVETELLAASETGLKSGMSAIQLARIIAFLLTEEAHPLSGSNLEIFSNG